MRSDLLLANCSLLPILDQALSFRMRHPNGTSELLGQISRHFHLPPVGNVSSLTPELQRHYFSSYLYLTQLQQALLLSYSSPAHHLLIIYSAPTHHLLITYSSLKARCYETAFTTWRQMRSSPAGTMGILYWQATTHYPLLTTCHPPPTTRHYFINILPLSYQY